VLIGLGVAFIFLLDPSKKVHDARAAAEAASLDAMALHMREAANRPDVNAAIQVAAVKDMQDAAVRVTGVALPELPAPKKMPARSPSRRGAGRVVMAADGSPAPRLSRPRGKKASR
jgi:hypothetical protein